MVEDQKPDQSAEFVRSTLAPSHESTAQDVLRWAIDLSRYAPSLYNAQPWSWRVTPNSAALFLDASRSFAVTDPDNREMRIGCGAALHHLQVALTVAGWRWELERFSGLDVTGLLARVRLTERCHPDMQSLEWVKSIPRRRTDRRPFSSQTVSADALAVLQSSVEAEGVHLQIVTHEDHRVWLAVLAHQSSALQIAREGYSDELARVRGQRHTPTNIPSESVPHVVSPRRSDVPLRDFELLDQGTLPIPEEVAERPIWCILWTERDTEIDWLLAGEALSRLLLNACDHGLAAGVQSQPVEEPSTRAELNRRLLSGMGHAQVMVRIGWAYDRHSELPPGPRRRLDEVTLQG